MCHLYLLHPPGGMVAGDSLAIAVNLAATAQSLITTPAAGKLYRVANGLTQYQGVAANLGEGALLEWLPQETIIFNGAQGQLINRFELAGNAQLIGWDIICLGRRASGERFTSGQLQQSIEIYRQGRPLFIDRVHFVGGAELLDAPWGMNGATVSGTLFATLGDESLSLDALREQLPAGNNWGLTRRGEILLLRYLGDSSQDCRRGFEALWGQLRPLLLKRAPLRPRIWNT
ncbi:MAG: urease accessory protein [Paraglaciecola psychrophila]|jgi:urease accessory protein